MHQHGIVAEALLASVLASYICYLLVVHYKSVSDRLLMYPHILGWSEKVVRTCQIQLRDIQKETGVVLELGSVSYDDLKAALEKLHPKGDAPMVDQSNITIRATWIQYLGVQMDRSQENINNVRSQLPFLNAEHVAILTKIDDSNYFNMLRNIRQVTLNNNAGFMAQSFLEY